MEASRDLLEPGHRTHRHHYSGVPPALSQIHSVHYRQSGTTLLYDGRHIISQKKADKTHQADIGQCRQAADHLLLHDGVHALLLFIGCIGCLPAAPAFISPGVACCGADSQYEDHRSGSALSAHGPFIDDRGGRSGPLLLTEQAPRWLQRDLHYRRCRLPPVPRVLMIISLH